MKIGEKRVKRSHFVTSNGHRRRGGGLKIFFGNSTFYALHHTQIWSNSERSIHKNCTQVKILLISININIHNTNTLIRNVRVIVKALNWNIYVLYKAVRSRDVTLRSPIFHNYMFNS